MQSQPQEIGKSFHGHSAKWKRLRSSTAMLILVLHHKLHHVEKVSVRTLHL